LEEYDRANRLEIDAVYAQFSPTLDDFYLETLHIDFPDNPPAAGTPETLRPEITLTRTVPGLQPKSVRAPGAAFPLRRCVDLAHRAVAHTPDGGPQATAGHLARLLSGEAWLVPVQVPRTQEVRLQLRPCDEDLLSRLVTQREQRR